VTLAQLAQVCVKRHALPAPCPEVAQIDQKLDGPVVLRGALRLDERVDPLPQFGLAPGEAVEVSCARSRLLTLAACALLRGALGCLAAYRRRPQLPA
jgi:hypothetical protein